MYDIYSNARDDSWRFTLGRSGARKLFTIGLNPSKATKEKSDPTVTRVQKVALDNGFDGFVMLNLYPVRATDFRALPREVDEEAFAENIQTIEALINAEKDPTIWAAWGENIAYHSFFGRALRELFSRLQPLKLNWVHFGEMTASGHPRHPSRLAYAWSFSPLDIESYVDSLRPSAVGGRITEPSTPLQEPACNTWEQKSRTNVSDIFNNEPDEWGLGGDPLLWRELKVRFTAVCMPDTREELKKMIEQEYEIATGHPISYKPFILVERLESQGMSSGGICPEFWVTRGIPLLVSRHMRP